MLWALIGAAGYWVADTIQEATRAPAVIVQNPSTPVESVSWLKIGLYAAGGLVTFWGLMKVRKVLR